MRRFARPVREIIHADQEMDEAALRLSLQEHPVLPVADGDEIVGVLARSELARAAKEQNRDVRITARVMMTTNLAFCYLDDDVATARALMDKHGCNHLMVVDRSRRWSVRWSATTCRRRAPARRDPCRSDRRSSNRAEEHAQGVASTIQPGGLDVYDERPTIRTPRD